MDNRVVDELEEVVKIPTRKKDPSNAALWVAFGFFNLVALAFDVIAAVTVHMITNNYLYSGLTFLAGFIPLAMHEALYVRAFATAKQRKLSIAGAVLAILSIVTVGVMAGMVNVTGYGVSVSGMAVVLIVVLVAAAHGILAAIYFYQDDGIRAAQTMASTYGYHQRRLERLKMADEILETAMMIVARQKEITRKAGSRAALDEVLRQLEGTEMLAPNPDGRKARVYSATADENPTKQR